MEIMMSLVRFSVRLLIGEAIFLFKSPRRSYFPLRLILSLSVFGLSIWGFKELFLLLMEVVGADVLSGLIWPFMMIGFFLVPFILTLCLIAFNFRIKLRTVLFVGCGGYSIEHISHSIISLVQYYILLYINEIPQAVNEILMIVPHIAITAFIYFVLIRPAERRGEMQNTNKGIVILSLINLAVCIVLSVFVSYGMGEPINLFTTNVLCKVYATLSCSLILCMQAGLFRQSKLRRDTQLMEQLLYKERKQHEISKETINLINMKCHDLKHQIRRLEIHMTNEERKESIEEISNAILIYDTIAKTGNDTLDIVLMEKSLLCESYKIKFSYIADGRKLSFMRAPDLYPLFGNMIDNAIESVKKEQDEEKRIISLRVWNEKGLLFIHIDNYCEDDIVFKGELPVTTKEDVNYHGFGVMSMRYIVQRYEGELKLDVKNNRFNVDIMFPLA